MAEQTVVESGVIRVDASGRRQYSVEFKRRLAQLALEPGASVAGIALAHRINANQLFKWRQDYLRQQEEAAALELEPGPEATLLPVVVAPAGREMCIRDSCYCVHFFTSVGSFRPAETGLA